MGTRIEIRQDGCEDDKILPSISLEKGSEIVIYDIALKEAGQHGRIRVKNLDDLVTAITPEPNFPGDVKDSDSVKPTFLTENNQREIFQYKTRRVGHAPVSAGEVVITHFGSAKNYPR